MAGLAGADRFNGGSGADIVTYDSSGAVRADLQSPGTNTGDAAGDSYVAIENLDGSSFNDILLGNGSANTIRGSATRPCPAATTACRVAAATTACLASTAMTH